jgi:hypothetical protein
MRSSIDDRILRLLNGIVTGKSPPVDLITNCWTQDHSVLLTT